MYTHILCLASRYFFLDRRIQSGTLISWHNDPTTCFVAISASFSALRSSYCARGLCSSSPATPPSSAPVYQSRSSLTCSSSHSLTSRPKAPSSPSGLPPLATLGVGASHLRFRAAPQPPSSPIELRGVESQGTLGTRTLGASRLPEP